MQIVGAQTGSTDPVDRSSKEIIISRSSGMATSEEFRAFWGEHIDPAWFSGKKHISPFLILIVLLSLLIFFLCSKPLFSPREIQNTLFELTESNKQNKK